VITLGCSDGAYCSACRQFYRDRPLPKGSDGTFIVKAFNKWNKSTGQHPKDNKLLKHELSDGHARASTVSDETKRMRNEGCTVYSMLHAQSDVERATNLERIMDYVDAAYFMFKNEIAHTTNYESLLSLVSRLDYSGTIKRFMNKSPDNATYVSRTTATEYLEAVAIWVRSEKLAVLKASPIIAIMGDESTDLRMRTELSICFRYLTPNGDAEEMFYQLTTLTATDATTITGEILKLLAASEIPVEKIFWIAFDGAANMSGRKTGVQAQLKKTLVNANYIHCRSHLLNLAAANVAEKMKSWKSLFSAFNSLWKVLHQSPKCHNKFVAVQQIMQDTTLELVRVGDTRWTSNYRAVTAIVKNLRAIVVTLQELHADSGDLSSEAGGLLLTFQDGSKTAQLFALAEILQPLHTLTLILQSTKLTLADFPLKVEMAVTRLQQICEDSCTYAAHYDEYTATCGYPLLGQAVNVDELHRNTTVPYINALLRNLEKRFGDTAKQVAVAAGIFEPKSADQTASGEMTISSLRSLCTTFNLDVASAVSEWNVFSSFLVKRSGKSANEVMQSLITTDLGDAFPTLSKLSSVLLACPLGTASVERSFSTMSRVCTRLRQRLTPEHLGDLMTISVEGPEILSRDDIRKIAYSWYEQRSRRIQFPRQARQQDPVASTSNC
jgi:Domain of unknown function (DUF4371)/hAT family C-terminal dimerisation region